MPTLPSLDDEDLDEVFTTGIDAALASNSAEREASTTTESTSIEYAPANEPRTSVEEKQEFGESEDENEESTAYDDILYEAKDEFRGEKPDFVITAAKLGTSRIVDLGDGQTGEMTLEPWDSSRGQGLWALEDNYGDRHIVKYFSKGRCYKAWHGIDEGYNDDAIAWPKKARRSAGSSTVEDDVVTLEKQGDSDDGHSHSLRKRTWTQENPYKADKEMHAATRSGRVKRKSDIDAREAERESKPVKKARLSTTGPATPRGTSGAAQNKQRRSRSTTTNVSDQPELSPEEFRAHVNARTSLLTKLPPDDEPIPIFLSECSDVTALWDKVMSMWESDIKGTVKSMSIKFTWLGPEYNIKLKAGLSGPYEKMIQEILDAPCWKDGTDKCSVDIVLVVA